MVSGVIADHHHPPLRMATGLAQVRHGMGQKSSKPFRIRSGYGRVCTTFAIELEVFGQADAKLPEQEFLLCRWLGNAT
jgi:hypothetical protein